jgi:hypothetical protein
LEEQLGGFGDEKGENRKDDARGCATDVRSSDKSSPLKEKEERKDAGSPLMR